MHPKEARWGLQEQLLAHIADSLAWIGWALGGGKGQKPQPIPRPGVQPRTQHYGEPTPHDVALAAVMENIGR